MQCTNVSSAPGMDIGLSVDPLTGEALAVAFEPSSLIVMGVACGAGDEPLGAVGVGHRLSEAMLYTSGQISEYRRAA